MSETEVKTESNCTCEGKDEGKCGHIEGEGCCKKNDVGVAKDAPVELRPPTKLQDKRRQILIDRVKRWMNKNPGKTEQEALMAIQLEDYERMPVGDKLKRLEAMFAGSMQQIGQDMMSLRHNQFALADAYDVNYRAISKMFAKLGISLEDQAKVMKEAADEFEAERKAAVEKHEAEQREKMEKMKVAQEKGEMEREAAEVNKPTAGPQGAEPPADATVFGG